MIIKKASVEKSQMPSICMVTFYMTMSLTDKDKN